MMSLGKEIKKARIDKGWQQKDLQRAMGFSQKHVSAIECDRVDPKLSVIKRLAVALGVSVAQLLKEDGDA